MIISDLNHLETVSENSSIEGGVGNVALSLAVPIAVNTQTNVNVPSTVLTQVAIPTSVAFSLEGDAFSFAEGDNLASFFEF